MEPRAPQIYQVGAPGPPNLPAWGPGLPKLASLGSRAPKLTCLGPWALLTYLLGAFKNYQFGSPTIAKLTSLETEPFKHTKLGPFDPKLISLDP